MYGRADDLVECGLSLVPLPPLHQDSTSGHRVDTEQDGIESRSAPRFRRATELLQVLAALPPCRVVEHPDRALAGVERQAGENLHPGRDPLQVVGQFGDVPEEPRPIVDGSGQEGLAVGVEGHGPDLSGMRDGWTERHPGGGVPEPSRLVPASGEDDLSIRAEGHGPDPGLMH